MKSEILLPECRKDRPHGTERPSSVLHPNGTVMASCHTEFLEVIVREVLDLYDAAIVIS